MGRWRDGAASAEAAAAFTSAFAMPDWFELALRRVGAKVSSASGTASAWTRTLTSAEAAPAAIVSVTVSGQGRGTGEVGPVGRVRTAACDLGGDGDGAQRAVAALDRER
ncbi:hypothetical protein [Methylobacterium sp. AMS5]|uniref:hypothetical protein n=1 Tax=Methylobacterium sp. AMS5 TaxID=925818 RepID=UPI00074F948F|nr:hypothetical protein [Methylobacterium sp. AMS5]AMB45239.1 hypothetical protein Y590_10015 [Methylobacterium sp. AMS5]